MNQVERDEHEIPCPRCGAEAEWSLVDKLKTTVLVGCPNCGQFEMRREEFDRTATDNAELTEPE
jgi:uncharacterized Zn finger protein